MRACSSSRMLAISLSAPWATPTVDINSAAMAGKKTRFTIVLLHDTVVALYTRPLLQRSFIPHRCVLSRCRSEIEGCALYVPRAIQVPRAAHAPCAGCECPALARLLSSLWSWIGALIGEGG